MLKKQRLFLAIKFTGPAREQLRQLTSLLQSQSRQGHFCRPEQLHLTLVFLGDCSPDEADLARGVLDSISLEPFLLTINRLDRFSQRDGDTWWAGLAESAPLALLQKELAAKLQKAGFLLEGRPYLPHITLGRRVTSRLLPHDVQPFSQLVSQLDLLESSRPANKLVYRSIHQIGRKEK